MRNKSIVLVLIIFTLLLAGCEGAENMDNTVDTYTGILDVFCDNTRDTGIYFYNVGGVSRSMSTISIRMTEIEYQKECL